MAYIESNDTEVHHIEYTWFGESQYPTTVSIPYPKVEHPVTGDLTVTSVHFYCFISFYHGYNEWCNLYYLMYFPVYVQPGTPNPVVKLFIVDTDNTTRVSEVVVPAPFRLR